MEIDEASPDVELPMERPLYSPPFKARVAQQTVIEGDESLAAEALFDQVYVDKTVLRSRIRQALQTRHQISLADLVEEWGIDQGLSELVAYLSLAADDDAAVIDDSSSQVISWTGDDGSLRQATLPLVVFTRRSRAKSA
jgi:hypothetical protein